MDRIYFDGNPWPNGHRIAHFEWSAHFKTEEAYSRTPGLYFDLHVKTAEYDEEDLDDELEEEEPPTDWQAKIVWNNYHSCTLSTQEWDDKGFCVGTADAPFNPVTLDGQTFLVDHLENDAPENFDFDSTAFDVYLLGHDAVAFHTITFTRIENNTYKIDWQGKLANTYAGDDAFKYDFQTVIAAATFRGILIPDEMTNEAAITLLQRFVSKPELFELDNNNGNRRFLFK